MPGKLIFLSHIHEEKDLAILIKNALESEFSGFVDVFVSSDGVSIPAGSNFLKRIEDGLVDCIGALYLISPASVKRNWINFELGAVWIRNAMSLRGGNAEVPAIPICHSGITPAGLPAPLNNLNAVVGNQASALEFAFRSIQSAVGGRGTLKTDFDELVKNIIEFERAYTLGANWKKLFSLLSSDRSLIVTHCQGLPPGSFTDLKCGFTETTIIQQIKQFESNELVGLISVTLDKAGMSFGPLGAVNGAELTIRVSRDSILQFKDLILA